MVNTLTARSLRQRCCRGTGGACSQCGSKVGSRQVGRADKLRDSRQKRSGGQAKSWKTNRNSEASSTYTEEMFRSAVTSEVSRWTGDLTGGSRSGETPRTHRQTSTKEQGGEWRLTQWRSRVWQSCSFMSTLSTSASPACTGHLWLRHIQLLFHWLCFERFGATEVKVEIIWNFSLPLGGNSE